MSEVLTDKELRNWRRIPNIGLALRDHFAALKPKSVDALAAEARRVYNKIAGDNCQPGSPIAELFGAVAEAGALARKARKKPA